MNNIGSRNSFFGSSLRQSWTVVLNRVLRNPRVSWKALWVLPISKFGIYSRAPYSLENCNQGCLQRTAPNCSTTNEGCRESEKVENRWSRKENYTRLRKRTLQRWLSQTTFVA